MMPDELEELDKVCRELRAQRALLIVLAILAAEGVPLEDIVEIAVNEDREAKEKKPKRVGLCRHKVRAKYCRACDIDI